MKITNKKLPQDLWEVLSKELSNDRKKKMLEVSRTRTQHIILVLQDVSSDHNICACLRSAEAFGIQDVYVINEKHKYKISTVAKGSSSWLTIYNYESIHDVALILKEKGYKLCAAVPKKDSTSLKEIEIRKPLAIVLGNEHSGLSKEWDKYIDLYFTIPMYGFVESLNISVSAAISMQLLTDKCRKILPPETFLLSKEKRTNLLNAWASKKIPHSEKKYKHLNKK